MSEHKYIFHGLPPMESFHFTYAPVDDDRRAEQRHAEVMRQFAALIDSAGDKEKMIALGKYIDAKKAEWADAIEPAKPE